MKYSFLLYAAIIIGSALNFHQIANAQNQSIILPIPGSNSSNIYDGCKTINFSNLSAPTILDLPKHTFYVGANLGRPHNENDLQNAAPSMDEKYLSQHPMFAQAVVHDADGNLLFFIVDNNIYNRYGGVIKTIC